MTLAYLWQNSWGKHYTAYGNKLSLLNLNIFVFVFFLVITYKCDLFGLWRDGFRRIFLVFSVLMIIESISQTTRLRPNGRYRRVMEKD